MLSSRALAQHAQSPGFNPQYPPPNNNNNIITERTEELGGGCGPGLGKQQLEKAVLRQLENSEFEFSV